MNDEFFYINTLKNVINIVFKVLLSLVTLHSSVFSFHKKIYLIEVQTIHS